MNDFIFARSQMAMSLAFHIVFAATGVGMPLLMVLAEGLYLRTGEAVYLDLCKRWAKGTAILFAVGAVSGTVLSFELGLLWPGFMEKAGAIIGMPFSLEGFAFFSEAIFLGVFLYGWKRLAPLWHWCSGVAVAASGILSAIFVVTANAWMNAPAGFKILDGKMTEIDPIAAMLNRASFHEALHMTLAAILATGFAVAGVHAFLLLRDRQNRFHRCALGIALAAASVSAPLQVLSGDFSARTVGALQPAKLAAMEADFRTETGPPLLIGGIPNSETGTTDYAIRIPHGLSFLLTHQLNSNVTGLDAFPRDQWPNVRIVHWSFDLMVACGTALFLVSIIAFWLGWKHHGLPDQTWFLWCLVVCGPLGFVAIESGWVVTELGRQPWIIYGILRTADAVTPMPGIAVPFITFTVLYIFLSVVVVILMRRLFLQTSHPGPGVSSISPHA